MDDCQIVLIALKGVLTRDIPFLPRVPPPISDKGQYSLSYWLTTGSNLNVGSLLEIPTGSQITFFKDPLRGTCSSHFWLPVQVYLVRK